MREPASPDSATSNRDRNLLFLTRITRMFAYGFLAVVLSFYLSAVGLSDGKIGWLLTLTLAGDTVLSLWLTTHADQLGRRRMLVAGAGLMLLAGSLFALTDNFYLLLVAAAIGVISPSGYEVGPFLSIEQASLSQLVDAERRTGVFAWYNLAGSFATAIGSLAGGYLTKGLHAAGMSLLGSYRVVLLCYAAAGFLLGVAFLFLTPRIEAPSARKGPAPWTLLQPSLGLHRSRRVVLKLSGLFCLDAFAGGFVIQAIVALWFSRRFGVGADVVGSIFFGANLLAGVSALSAAWVAGRVGLVNTMVFTHVPSNLLLMLVPLMPSLPLAIAVLFARFSISQMDVPTRQSYTMAVVDPDERSAAAGVTGIARTIGASLSPVLTGPLLANPALLGVPFFLAGGLKIVYDLLLYGSFKALKPPEERR